MKQAGPGAIELKSFPKVRFLITWILKSYFHTQGFGAENIPETGSFVVASNHASVLDPVLIGYTSEKREVGFMAKNELFRVPILGIFIRNVGAFPVKRGERDMDAVNQFHNFLHSGKPLVVFVEGTRTLNGELQPAKKGSGRLFYNAKVPVIPAYIGGTFQCWPKGKLLPRVGHTFVRYGPPIPLDDLYRENPDNNTYIKIAQRVMEHIAKLKGDKPQIDRAKTN